MGREANYPVRRRDRADMGLTFRRWLENDETLNRKVQLPPSECPCKKKKKDTVGYPVPMQQTNQLFAVPSRIAGGY